MDRISTWRWLSALFIKKQHSKLISLKRSLIFIFFLFTLTVTMFILPSKTSAYPKVRFDYTVSEINKICSSITPQIEAKLAELLKISTQEKTFQNTVVGFESVLNELDDTVSPILFLKETSPDTSVQDEAAKCQDTISAFYAKLFTRADLYLALQEIEKQNPQLNDEESKLLSEMLKSFRRSGAALPDAERSELADLRKKLTELENQFATNYAKANDTIELTTEMLEGLPADFKEGLTKTDNNTYLLTLLDASSYLPFMENAKSEQARKAVVTAHDKVAADVNTPLLEQAIALRDQIAKKLGYPSHAAYSLESKMAKTPEAVLSFLKDLSQRLKPKLKSDLDALLDLKKKENPSASSIEIWDWRYYANQINRTKYAVDHELIKEYFPVDHVIATVFDLYQKLFSLKFKEISPAKAWYNDVKLYEVRDQKTDELVGHFYFDIYPRPNKYKHFAAFPILQERRNVNGKAQTPVAAIVGNFPKPTNGNPSLLRHNDVETFFHEFGHIMHQVVTTAQFSSLAGTNVRGDYVEAPSQMLENWAWEESVLKKLSHHYKTGNPLPDDLIAKLLNSEHANEGLSWSRQLFFASVDMAYHTSGPTVDTKQIWHNLHPQIFGMAAAPDAQPQATFGHLMGGYDAGYYGYLWSKVFAEDMYTAFEKEGLENPETGGRYRKWILEPGAIYEPDVLIKKFLGRDPTKEAFYKSLGI